MTRQFLWIISLALVGVISYTAATMLPPRLSTPQKTIRVKEGQTKVVLECNLDLGDDPIAYRWLKHFKLVTADLGFAYRTYRKVHLALHTITKIHNGIYECEAANDAGVDAVRIEVVVVPGDYTTPFRTSEDLPDTSKVLSEFAASLNDVLAEGNCNCDVMFLLHASPDAPEETLAAQANFVNIIADPIISDSVRVAVMTYSDYVNSKISFGQGTNKCALSEGLRDLSHEKWTTRIQPVLRDALKKFKKSQKDCKVLFLPIFGSLGTEGAQMIVANHLKKIGVTVFILEVTDNPVEGVEDMSSRRGDGKPYHWRIPKKIWPTIISYMSYMTEELTGCMSQQKDIPEVCVSEGENCTQSSQCKGIGYGCLQGTCRSLECNINPSLPGCCTSPGDFWCGDVTLSCKSRDTLCDGIIQCMNGLDEENDCWQTPCQDDKGRCQSSTLCLSMYDLCDGDPHCPGAEDEDPKFCRSFPCPVDRPFRCRSGKCLSTDSLCDGTFRDCSDGEDENLEYCSEKHVCPSTRPFKCDYGVCIPERMVCDGAFNCLDALDERLCHERNCPAERPFKCGDGKCVDLALVCNGVVDACVDGLDEKNCTNFVCPADRSFKCMNGRCIDKWLECDKRNDCGDNTDEENCERPTSFSTTTEVPQPASPSVFPKPTKATCLDDEFYCTSGACLSTDKVCDGRQNCIDGEDEDEELCRNYPCPESRSFRCPDGACVKVAFCDGVPDCPDGSDEDNCIVHHQDEYEDYEVDKYRDEDGVITAKAGDEEGEHAQTVFEETERHDEDDTGNIVVDEKEFSSDDETLTEDIKSAASSDRAKSGQKGDGIKTSLGTKLAPHFGLTTLLTIFFIISCTKKLFR